MSDTLVMRGRMARTVVDEKGETESVIQEEASYRPDRIMTRVVIFRDRYLSRLKGSDRWDSAARLDMLTPYLHTLQVMNDDYGLIAECIWNHLRVLKLHRVVSFSFRGMTQLTHVELRNMSVPIEGLKRIIRLPALTALCIWRMLLVTDQTHTVASIWPADGSRTLTSLDYGGWHTTGEDLTLFVQNCASLKYCRIAERSDALDDAQFVNSRSITELRVGLLERDPDHNELNYQLCTLTAQIQHPWDILRFKSLTSVNITCAETVKFSTFCKQMSSILLANSLPNLSVLGLSSKHGPMCYTKHADWGKSVRFLYRPLQQASCTVLQVIGCLGREFTPRHVVSSSCSTCDRVYDAYQLQKERNRMKLIYSQKLCVLYHIRRKTKEKTGVCEMLANILDLASPWIVTTDGDPKGDITKKKNKSRH